MMPDGNDHPFVPDDPALYGPDPSIRPARSLVEVFGLSALQFTLVLFASIVVFVFLGGPVWSAPRERFPARLFVSYLVIPVLVVALLWRNRARSWWTAIVASLAIAAAKFALTALLDVTLGLMRRWPP